MNKIFKDAYNQIHEINEDFAHLLPDGCVEITQSEADVLRAPTAEDIEAKRVQDIIDKADKIILGKYSEKKQRKLLAISAKLSYKEFKLGIPLTQEENDLLGSINLIDEWIASVRDVENAGVADGSNVEDLVFPE
jgi:hypothetical protein